MVYLDHFRSFYVESGERAQTALEKKRQEINEIAARPRVTTCQAVAIIAALRISAEGNTSLWKVTSL